jgi:hypothetical protein
VLGVVGVGVGVGVVGVATGLAPAAVVTLVVTMTVLLTVTLTLCCVVPSCSWITGPTGTRTTDPDVLLLLLLPLLFCWVPDDEVPGGAIVC